jgi:hypothetical protein
VRKEAKPNRIGQCGEGTGQQLGVFGVERNSAHRRTAGDGKDGGYVASRHDATISKIIEEY